MPRDFDGLTRELAEERVRNRQAQERGNLLKEQDKERRAAFHAQKAALDQNARREAAAVEGHRLAAERLEREWQQQRDRLGNRPGPAPALEPPAQRNLNSEYERAREQYLRSREALEQRLDAERASCQSDRAELLKTCFETNQERESAFEEQRRQLEEEQRRDFEALVLRQIRYGRETPRENFARHARPLDRDI